MLLISIRLLTPARRHKVVDYIRRERQILDSLAHPGVAALHFTFQDAYSLYLGLEHCPNGAALLPLLCTKKKCI